MMKCLGCGTQINWNGNGAFCYTCLCGATVFYDEKVEEVAVPASLITALKKGRELPHIVYYLGKSSYWDSK